MGVMHACHYPGCSKKFDRKYNLKCHLRIHSDEKPYRCHHQNCARSFRWKSSLNHHLMSLDHTLPADRRARKALAARRRYAQKMRSQSSTVQQPPFPPGHQFLDLPVHSAVSSRAISHSASPVPSSSQSHPFSSSNPLLSRKLNLDHRLDVADLSSFSSLHNLTANASSNDLSLLSTTPSQQQQQQQPIDFNTHLSRLTAFPHPQHHNPIHATAASPAIDSNVSSPIWPSAHNVPYIPSINSSVPLSTPVPSEARVSLDESSIPNQYSASQPLDAHDLPSQVELKDYDCGVVTGEVLSNCTSQAVMDSLFDSEPLLRHSSSSLVKHGAVNVQKQSTPLVSIFDEVSPAYPINLSSALDTLFHATNIDTGALKSF